MAEPVFRLLEMTLPRMMAANGTHVTYQGLENIPERGGALIAMNHTSQIDWYGASTAAMRRGRRLRFLIKAEMQDVPVIGSVIKRIKLIPVDRRTGADAYAVAAQRLKEGELVGLHPEGTISRSFELMDFKTGVARLAQAADVPIIPAVVWGAQRIWTKDQPKKLLRNKVPLLVKVGKPMPATADAEATTAELHRLMSELLAEAQQEYPHPAGAPWVPRRLGGGAPTVAEALVMRDAEIAERDRVHAAGTGVARLRQRLAGAGRRR